MKLQTIFETRRYYTGKPLESGGTSIQGGAAPAIRWLFKSGHFKEGDVILDYGAGKYGRNAEFLRNRGFKVYAYDPFNGHSDDGWLGVSKNLPPNVKFDFAFTSFVINVVPEKIEREIIAHLKRIADDQIHLTRNRDIFDTVKKAFKRGDKLVTGFYQEHYNPSWDMSMGTPADEEIMDFCHFGDVLRS